MVGMGKESRTAFVFMANGVWLVWMWHFAWGVWRWIITSRETGEGLFLNSVHLFWSLLPIIMTKSLPQGNIWYLMWTCHTHFQSWSHLLWTAFYYLFCLFFADVFQIAFLRAIDQIRTHFYTWNNITMIHMVHTLHISI